MLRQRLPYNFTGEKDGSEPNDSGSVGDKETPPSTSNKFTCAPKDLCLLLLSIVVAILAIALAFCLASTSDTPPVSLLSMAPNEKLASPKECSVNRDQLGQDLLRMRTRIRNEADRKGSVSWAQYAQAPQSHTGKRVEIRAHDFDGGTLRLQTSGVFVLLEDVEFEPNAQNDHRPDRASQPEYAGSPFVLDFFAALTVEARDIVIDLNGHVLAQSEVHATQQRFFALIEAAGQPFLSTQGPASFGADPFTVNGLVIENGVLGRSSHHGIHGNGGSRVLIQDLRIRHYEVAALAFNGFKDVLIRRVHAEGSFTAIPVLGTYSNARFLLPFIDRVLDSNLISQDKTDALVNARDALADVMEHVLVDVRANGVINAQTHPEAYALFGNPSGLCDGNSYGLALHPNGVAVGPFWSESPPASGTPSASERIVISECTFVSTHNSVVEVVALVSQQDVTVRGPVGDVLRIIDNADRVKLFTGEDGAYNGNVLSDAQIAFIDASLDVTDEVALKRFFGTTHGDEHVVAWAHAELTLAQLVRTHDFHYWRNGDTMFHVNKGVLGARVDGARDVCFDAVTISDTRNDGARGIMYALPGEDSTVEASYVGAIDGGHPQQAPQYGYMGADARGLGISGAINIHLRQLQVDGVHSRYGFARGIDVFNAAEGIHVGSLCSVNDVASLVDDSELVLSGEYANGVRVGSAVGVHCSGGSAENTFGGGAILVSNVLCGSFDQAQRVAVSSVHEKVTVESIHPNTYEM